MSECIFCSRKEYPEKMIFETENFIVRAGLGLITSGQCMIITKDHFPAIAAIPDSLNEEFVKLKNYLYDVISDNFAEPFLLENGIFGQSVFHAHIHFIPKSSSFYSSFDPFVEMINPVEEKLKTKLLKTDFNGLKNIYEKYEMYRTISPNKDDFYTIVERKNLEDSYDIFDYRTNFSNKYKDQNIAVKWKYMTEKDIQEDLIKIKKTVEILSKAFKNYRS